MIRLQTEHLPVDWPPGLRQTQPGCCHWGQIVSQDYHPRQSPRMSQSHHWPWSWWPGPGRASSEHRTQSTPSSCPSYELTEEEKGLGSFQHSHFLPFNIQGAQHRFERLLWVTNVGLAVSFNKRQQDVLFTRPIEGFCSYYIFRNNWFTLGCLLNLSCVWREGERCCGFAETRSGTPQREDAAQAFVTKCVKIWVSFLFWFLGLKGWLPIHPMVWHDVRPSFSRSKWNRTNL